MASTAIAAAYTPKLNDVFDRVFVHGVAELPKANLLLWLDKSEKVTKKTWRDVQEAWNRRCKDEWEYDDNYIPTILVAYNSYTRTYILIFADDTEIREAGGEKELWSGTWFKPLTQVNEKIEKEEEE